MTPLGIGNYIDDLQKEKVRLGIPIHLSAIVILSGVILSDILPGQLSELVAG